MHAIVITYIMVSFISTSQSELGRILSILICTYVQHVTIIMFRGIIIIIIC